ncbi:hypothetical protein FQN50_003128 [Emmonsiellopsis sp. PD_5]|nr:hypothetical protein FQN50_003128 [Emmonsiellopsis sp. PD_5]
MPSRDHESAITLFDRLLVGKPNKLNADLSLELEPYGAQQHLWNAPSSLMHHTCPPHSQAPDQTNGPARFL